MYFGKVEVDLETMKELQVAMKVFSIKGLFDQEFESTLASEEEKLNAAKDAPKLPEAEDVLHEPFIEGEYDDIAASDDDDNEEEDSFDDAVEEELSNASSNDVVYGHESVLAQLDRNLISIVPKKKTLSPSSKTSEGGSSLRSLLTQKRRNSQESDLGPRPKMPNINSLLQSSLFLNTVNNNPIKRQIKPHCLQKFVVRRGERSNCSVCDKSYLHQKHVYRHLRDFHSELVRPILEKEAMENSSFKIGKLPSPNAEKISLLPKRPLPVFDPEKHNEEWLKSIEKYRQRSEDLQDYM